MYFRIENHPKMMSVSSDIEQIGRGTLDRESSNLTKKMFLSNFFLYMILKKIKKLYLK